MFKDLGQTIRLEVARAARKIVWLLPLFLVSLLVPIVGELVYLVVGGYLLSKFAGMDYIDWSAARRGWSWRRRLAFAGRHRYVLVGFGSLVVLSLMIPLAFVALWPGAVAGGTLLFADLTRSGPPGADSTGPVRFACRPLRSCRRLWTVLSH